MPQYSGKGKYCRVSGAKSYTHRPIKARGPYLSGVLPSSVRRGTGRSARFCTVKEAAKYMTCAQLEATMNSINWVCNKWHRSNHAWRVRTVDWCTRAVYLAVLLPSQWGLYKNHHRTPCRQTRAEQVPAFPLSWSFSSVDKSLLYTVYLLYTHDRNSLLYSYMSLFVCCCKDIQSFTIEYSTVPK
jgi:hypothetical protein